MARIGIDFGGTKIEGILLDQSGIERARKRIATPRGYRESLEAIVSVVTDLEGISGLPRMTVGVGIPGALSPQTRTVKNANSTFLIGERIDEDLRAALGCPVRVANDANCLAVSEATDGAGAGFRVVFAVILGTGCGGGIAMDGRVHEGPNAIAGEWGHNPLPWPEPWETPGPECYCGRRGCIEAWLSGPSLEARYRAAAGRDVPATSLKVCADAGDDAARDCLAVAQHGLARSLALVVNTLDPDLIVVGGGVSPLIADFSNLEQHIKSYVFGAEFSTPVRRAVHGDASGVRGAAWLFSE